ncbi:MAG TPA: phosphopantetheine-binding protein [Anaeromyxobacteraceae bacterium]|nr:phosphopantetheine-binding protein [Anaeromyxobacteraceae bacterium]
MEAQVKANIHQHIVSTWLSGDERGFSEDTDLQESGILDSFSTLALIGFLDKTFSVQLEPADINAETFRSVASITRLVMEKLAKTGDGRSPG